MNRRKLLGCLGSGSLASIAGCSNPLKEEPDSFKNPVFEPIFADPTAIRTDDETYYAYATGDDWHDGERLVPIIKSSDLVNWEYVGEALGEKPDWKESGGIWAPDISKHRGKYYLYYSYSKWGDPNPGIGLAIADSPEGPFEDRGKLFTSDEIGVTNSIDPYFYRDNGTPYLFWGSFHGIYGVELTKNGFDVAGKPFQIGGDMFEATHILRHDGTYYFFASSGACCKGMDSTYRVTVGRSDSLKGPYTDGNGNDLLKYQGRLVVKGTDHFVGPGHNTVVTDDTGDYWTLYHAYEDPNYYLDATPRRALMADKLVWSDDGFPHVPDRTPSKQAPVPSAK